MTHAPEACPSKKFCNEQENQSSNEFNSSVDNLNESKLKNRLLPYTESLCVAEQLPTKSNNLIDVGSQGNSNAAPSEKNHRSSLMLIAEASALQSQPQS